MCLCVPLGSPWNIIHNTQMARQHARKRGRGRQREAEGGRGREREGEGGRRRAGKGGKGRGKGKGRERERGGRIESKKNVIEKVKNALHAHVTYPYRVTGIGEDEFKRCESLQGHSGGKFLARAGNSDRAPLVELLDQLNKDEIQENHDTLAYELDSFGVDPQYELLHEFLKGLSPSTGMQAIIGVEGMGNCAIFSADVIHILSAGASPSWPNGEDWTSVVRTKIGLKNSNGSDNHNPLAYLSLEEFWAVWDRYSDSNSPAPAALVIQEDSWEWFVNPNVESRQVTAKIFLVQSKSHFFPIAFEKEITVKDSLADALEAASCIQHKGPSKQQGDKGFPPSPSPTFPPFHPSTLPSSCLFFFPPLLA